MGTRRRCRILAASVALSAATLCHLPHAVALPDGQPRSPQRLETITIPAPATEIPAKWLSYPGPARANVLLPAGYDPRQRYPLLVMLNGLSQDYSDYQNQGLLPAFEGLDAIVVMPEGGSGWYADWWNDGKRGDPSWETYELDTVIPAILARYPIRPERRYHAIAGLSMGGLGAIYLGGRLPGFFGTVASLSGFVDLAWQPTPIAPLPAVIVDLGMGLTAQPAVNRLIDGTVPDAQTVIAGDYRAFPVLGPPDGFYFNGHNPPRVAINLQHTRVFQTTGTGVPSPAGLATVAAGGPLGIAVGSAEEGPIIYPMNRSLHAALVAAGVDVTYQEHPGGHDNPDFIDEIKAMIRWGLFEPVPTNPTAWVNDTVATTGQLWDIHYQFDQPPTDVVRFRRTESKLSISAAGSDVTIAISGHCTIRTATPANIDLAARGC